MNMIPKVIPITTKEIRDRVKSEGESDNHDVSVATHYLEKNGEIAGAWNLGAIPLVMNWQHSKRITPRDSMYLQNTLDFIMNERGHKVYLSACEKNSPYRPYMEKLGYKLVMSSDIFAKQTGE
jgi:hypothetical protein